MFFILLQGDTFHLARILPPAKNQTFKTTGKKPLLGVSLLTNIQINDLLYTPPSSQWPRSLLSPRNNDTCLHNFLSGKQLRWACL
jgi:hypothetical protein